MRDTLIIPPKFDQTLLHHRLTREKNAGQAEKKKKKGGSDMNYNSLMKEGGKKYGNVT